MIQAVLTTIILCSSLSGAFGGSIDTDAWDTGVPGSQSHHEGILNEQPSEITPSLLSKSRNLTVFEGDNITLLCQIADIGDTGYGTLWRYKDDSLLFASRMRVTHDLRLNVKQNSKEDFSLTISDVKASDAGKYSCTLSIPAGPSAVYHLTVKARPPTPHPKTLDALNGVTPHGAAVCNSCQMFTTVMTLVVACLFAHART